MFLVLYFSEIKKPSKTRFLFFSYFQTTFMNSEKPENKAKVDKKAEFTGK